MNPSPEGPRRSRRRRIALLATSLIAAMGAIVGGSPAAQAANTNPIKWTVYKTLYGKHHEDVPLRYGQNDQRQGSTIAAGFGTRHIEGKHALWGDWPSTANKIEDTIQHGKCSTSGTSVTCTTGAAYIFVAVYSTRVDSRSRDGGPVGVITFYYFCNTCKAPSDSQATPDVSFQPIHNV